jgi:multisubunit Na+/H+ antiporter MnhF subunit
MDIPNIFLKLVIILFALTGLFLVEKFIAGKEKETNGAKWRFISGIIQLILSLLIFRWSKKYSLNIGHLLVMIGMVVLALGGIGEIFIGILNIAAARMDKK